MKLERKQLKGLGVVRQQSVGSSCLSENTSRQLWIWSASCSGTPEHFQRASPAATHQELFLLRLFESACGNTTRPACACLKNSTSLLVFRTNVSDSSCGSRGGYGAMPPPAL